MIFEKKTYDIFSSNVIILILIFVLLSLSGTSQTPETIDLDKVPQRKVRKYIEDLSIDKMQDFSLIHPTWHKGIDESAFNVNAITFYLKHKLSDVWQCYIHANPLRIWNRKSVRLGLEISKGSNSVIYANNPVFPEIDTGQVYFLNLKLIQGLLNVPVAFEVINIDKNQYILETSYIENNKTRGKQTIQFFDNGDGRTRIIHKSFFKSESSFRDNILYPHFHKRFIKKFHRNMEHLLTNSKPQNIGKI
jgi:hypothetical protein